MKKSKLLSSQTNKREKEKQYFLTFTSNGIGKPNFPKNNKIETFAEREKFSKNLGKTILL